MLPGFAYARPSTLDEAVRLAARPGTRVHGGGTDLLGYLRDGAASADTVVSLQGIASLRGMAATADGGVRLGALTTLAEIAADRAIRERWPVLGDAAAAAASPQLRNQGTIGGNLCQKPRCWYWRGEFPCLRKGGDTCFAMNGENELHAVFGGDACVYVHPSDTAPALVACEALVRIVGTGGSRVVPVETFFVLPAEDPHRETVLEAVEVVAEIILPAPPPGARGVYRKARSRGAWDFALAGVAIAAAVKDHRVTHARVVLSGVAPAPWRVPEVERLLTGARLTADLAVRAATAATRGAVPLAGNGYKVSLVRGLVQEALATLA